MAHQLKAFALAGALAAFGAAQASAQDEAADAPGVVGLYDAAGAFHVDFLEDGHYVVFSEAQGVRVIGHYELADGEITLDDRTGGGSCPDMIGRYGVEATDEALTLTLVEDACEGRIAAIEEVGVFTRVAVAAPEAAPADEEAPGEEEAAEE